VTNKAIAKALKCFGVALSIKSAMRESSLDAYKKIFTLLREDLTKALKHQ
jgi:hypothetical protein